MAYSDLGTDERAFWDAYQTLRAITDWDGFTDDQERRKLELRRWLDDRQDFIWRLAEGLEEGQKAGWGHANRRARWQQLTPESLNSGQPRHEVRLPATGSFTATERVMIEEREGWLAIDAPRALEPMKAAQAGWLVRRRQELYRLIKEEPRSSNIGARKRRYRDLCIATHHGVHYTRWEKTHNKYGVPLKPDEPEGDTRTATMQRARSFLGTSERPAGSNRGPGISDWQRRVIGADGFAWCACFAVCMCWDGGVEGAGSAGVVVCMTMAQRGQGMFRGWTTDPSRVRRGDMAVISCSTCHIGLVDGPSPYSTVEGNTSPGSEGSQFNGGTVASRDRRGQIVGWALVRHED